MERDDADIPVYSIGEIADKAGISRRAVRYYVQRGLIDPPIGRGRASGYTDHHAEQITRVLRLQREGLSLDAISQASGESGLDANASKPLPEIVLRLTLIPGVRLEMDAGCKPPAPDVLDELARACARILQRTENSSRPQNGPSEEGEL